MFHSLYGLVFGLLSQMQPLPSEKIASISLNDDCKQVSIVEWQQQPKPYLSSIRILNKACNQAYKNFHLFLKTKNISAPVRPNLVVNISLLDDRVTLRGLNDPLRFKNRYFEVDKAGKIIPILGYYHYNPQHIFIFNGLWIDEDPNPEFIKVFEHEIFHALIHQNNLHWSLPEPKDATDEKYAREFTEYLGLGS